MEEPQVWGGLVWIFLVGFFGFFFFLSLPSPPGGSSEKQCSLGSPSQMGATRNKEHGSRCPSCPQPATSPGRSRWVCGWAQGVDSGREILSVGASPRLCQTPAKLPAEEEEAAAARVPLLTRPAPRCAPAAHPGPAAAARRWIRAAHQQTTAGRRGKRKKEGRKERKGAGGGVR